jgi:hypothetical protein
MNTSNKHSATQAEVAEEVVAEVAEEVAVEEVEEHQHQPQQQHLNSPSPWQQTLKPWEDSIKSSMETAPELTISSKR